MSDTTTIDAREKIATLINVFTVEPADQQRLIDLLNDATETTMRHVPGFISANIHASTDGTRVANYAQWESEGAFKAMLADPKAREHFGPIEVFAKADPHTYTVASVHRA